MPYTYKGDFVETNPHIVYSSEPDTSYAGFRPLELAVGEHGTAELGYISDLSQDEPVMPVTAAPVGSFVFIFTEPDEGYGPDGGVIAGGVAPVPVQYDDVPYFVMPDLPVAVTVEFNEII